MVSTAPCKVEGCLFRCARCAKHVPDHRCSQLSVCPLPYEVHQDADRPDSCIGTADFHTPAELSEMVVRLCRHAGWTIAVNKPFAGAPVPMPYFRADARVRTKRRRRGGYFDSCRSKLCTVMGDLIDESFVRRD